MKEKNIYIIAGCNGAGKTTASFTILPEILDCKEFVNADEIAKGLSPFQPEKVAIEAGRIMLNRINELFADDENFAFETTLSTRSYRNKITDARNNGYDVTLLFFWLQSVELAKEIAAKHDVPFYDFLQSENDVVLTFPDHHHFSEGDILNIKNQAV